MHSKLSEAKKQHELQLDEVNRETASLKEALHTLENRVSFLWLEVFYCDLRIQEAFYVLSTCVCGR